ncbi:MAG: DUF5998 family protein [Rothia sp. (in: high G+C Gram-positive bacteria)]|nr:DUF5998 family protein [Rothia sp. (in: high G+C Gram-positive bacteria)]
MTPSAAEALTRDIQQAGFYPELVLDTVAEALSGLAPTSHLVQVETHFDQNELHRHITVLVLAGHILLVAHLDDQNLDENGQQVLAHVSVETLHVSRLRTLTVSYTYPQPQHYRTGSPVSEVSLLIAWTGSQRLDVQPAECPDPVCEADHGYTGMSPREDMLLRVSTPADGADATAQARSFARALRSAHMAAMNHQTLPTTATVQAGA